MTTHTFIDWLDFSILLQYNKPWYFAIFCTSRDYVSMWAGRHWTRASSHVSYELTVSGRAKSDSFHCFVQMRSFWFIHLTKQMCVVQRIQEQWNHGNEHLRCPSLFPSLFVTGECKPLQRRQWLLLMETRTSPSSYSFGRSGTSAQMRCEFRHDYPSGIDCCGFDTKVNICMLRRYRFP